MSDKPENPPAFPGHPSEPGEQFDHGMTLRDYFAAHAPLTYLDGETWEDHAEDRYNYADAMLAERIK